MDVYCSFKSIVGGTCGFDKRSRKQEAVIIPLLTCSKRIDSHSTSFGFSGPKDEVDLILSRAAIFSPPGKIHSMTICPWHRAKLGLGWTRGSSTRCRVPSDISNHGKSGRTWPKCDRGIGKRDSEIILKRTGVFLQVGSGELTFARFFIQVAWIFFLLIAYLTTSDFFQVFAQHVEKPQGPFLQTRKRQPLAL